MKKTFVSLPRIKQLDFLSNALNHLMLNIENIIGNKVITNIKYDEQINRMLVEAGKKNVEPQESQLIFTNESGTTVIELKPAYPIEAIDFCNALNQIEKYLVYIFEHAAETKLLKLDISEQHLMFVLDREIDLSMVKVSPLYDSSNYAIQSDLFSLDEDLFSLTEETAPSQEETPLVEDTVPSQEGTPLVDETLPKQEETPLVEDTVPKQEGTPLVEDTVPKQEQASLVEDTVPKQEETPIVEDTVPKQEQAPLVEETVPSQEGTPLVEETVPSQEGTPLVEDVVPSQEQAPLVEDAVPSQEQAPLVEDVVPSQEQAPLVEDVVPSQEQAPLVDETLPKQEETPIAEDVTNPSFNIPFLGELTNSSFAIPPSVDDNVLDDDTPVWLEESDLDNAPDFDFQLPDAPPLSLDEEETPIETNNNDHRSNESLMIIDGNNLLLRGYFATAYNTDEENLKRNVKGQFINANDLFIQQFKRYIKMYPTDSIIICFDNNNPFFANFRKKTFDGYKATREEKPVSLIQQLDTILGVLKTLNIPYIMDEKGYYEADDLIGSLILKWRKHSKGEIYIVSNDKDLHQLLDDEHIYQLIKKDQDTLLSLNDFTSKFGITTSQWIDAKAILGDKTDNIPGVVGVGETYVYELLKTYGTLENIYNNLESLKTNSKYKRYATKFEEQKKEAYLSKFLATIIRKEDIECIGKLDTSTIKVSSLPPLNKEYIYDTLGW